MRPECAERGPETIAGRELEVERARSWHVGAESCRSSRPAGLSCFGCEGRGTNAGELDEVELAAWRGLLKVHAALVKELDAELEARHGLPLTSYEVLRSLRKSPRRQAADGRARRARAAQPLGHDAPDRPARARGPRRALTCDKDGRGCYAVLTERAGARLRPGPRDLPRRRAHALPAPLLRQESCGSRGGRSPGSPAVGVPAPSTSTPRRRVARPHRHAAARPRRGPHAGLRPARHQGRGQDARGLRGRRPRLRHGARQHVPPVPRARPRADRALRRPAPVHALGRARSSPTPAASRSSRWATAPSPTRSRAASAHGERAGHDPRDRGGGRALPLLPRRLRAVHGARRPRWRSRPRCGSDIALVFDECTPVPRHARLHGALDRAHAPLARPLPRLARRARPGRPARLRDRPGRRGGGPAPRVRPGGRRARARAGSRSAARSGRTSRRCTRSSSWAVDELPEERPRHLLGIGDDRRPAARRRARHRHLRLRDADPPRPPRDGGRARPERALARRPRQGPLPRGRRAADGGLPVPGLRARATRAATCTTCCKARESTASRLLTIHNLAYLQRLMAGAARRTAIDGRPRWPSDRGRASCGARTPRVP